MKNLFFSFAFICLTGICFPAFSQNVSLEKAKKIAQNFYTERYNLVHTNGNNSMLSISDLELQNVVKSASENNLYYIFDVKKGGYIIVSANEKVTPVLGYSFESKFVYPITCPSVKGWMQHYDEEIAYAIKNNISPTSDVKEAWQEYMLPQINKQKGTKSVTQLLLTTWDQGNFYNQMCPVDAAGDGGHVWAGCVATSMAQVMKYYNYPPQGNGSNSYNASPYGVQTVNFGSTLYKWNDMTLSVTQTNSAVAELLYHCGVSVNMNYGAGTTGSGALSTDAATALVSNFKYSSTTSFKSKYAYTTTNWNNLLISNLDLGRPMIYSGSTSGGEGHAWNCDGYQGTNSFHMNWGWSGYYNGFFTLDALTVDSYDFSYMQGAIVNIYPGQSYPYYCTGTKTLTATVGTFDDGSGPSNYQNNSDCSWLIAPTATVTKIILTFDDFSTESGNDVVTVYDGETTSSPVLGTYSGSSLPASLTITSTGNKMLVSFTSNGTGTASGFHASYTTSFPPYCASLTNLTAFSDTFSDGSGVNNYNPTASCRWRILPPGATTITLSFSEFNLTDNSDVIEVYNVTSGNVLLNAYSGSVIPADVTYAASKIMVWFKANSQTPGEGFTASYTCDVSGIENITDFKNLNIYPNPAENFISVTFNNLNSNKMMLKLFSTNGQKVFESEKVIQKGNNALLIPVNDLSEGIYFLNLTTEKSNINYKIIIQH